MKWKSNFLSVKQIKQSEVKIKCFKYKTNEIKWIENQMFSVYNKWNKVKRKSNVLSVKQMKQWSENQML